MGYNWRFIRAVKTPLKSKRVGALYQRHGRFMIAGAVLSRALGAPLILEYNGSEEWLVNNWDPSRFKLWVRLFEEYALKHSSLIVVVSEPLRQELIQRGVPPKKILVNPNAVDPEVFKPQADDAVRSELGLRADDLVVCFVGSFSYWHGMNVLQEAARRLLVMGRENARLNRLRFLLIGDGPLRAEVAAHLQSWVADGHVIFTGSVSHDQIPRYLNAADIFVAPHIPLTDGTPFFGSPTKLFEYMAMGRAIIASNLGQIGQVLKHGESGWLVTPGDVDELVNAVITLADSPELRRNLGTHARRAVLECHTWKQNAQTVVNTISGETAKESFVFRHSDINNAAPKRIKSGG